MVFWIGLWWVMVDSQGFGSSSKPLRVLQRCFLLCRVGRLFFLSRVFGVLDSLFIIFYFRKSCVRSFWETLLPQSIDDLTEDMFGKLSKILDQP